MYSYWWKKLKFWRNFLLSVKISFGIAFLSLKLDCFKNEKIWNIEMSFFWCFSKKLYSFWPFLILFHYYEFIKFCSAWLLKILFIVTPLLTLVIKLGKTNVYNLQPTSLVLTINRVFELAIYLSIFIYLSINIHLSIYLYIYLPIYLFIYLSIYLSNYLTIYNLTNSVVLYLVANRFNQQFPKSMKIIYLLDLAYFYF